MIGVNAYAVIRDEQEGFFMDQLLTPGKGAWKSLRESALEDIEKAKRLRIRADRLLEAASILENEHNAKLKEA